MASTENDSYYEELREYYKLKDKYDSSKHKKIYELVGQDYGKDYDQKKQTLAKFKPKCINCKQEGGTIFTETLTMFRATCGNSVKPCTLDFVVQRKKFAQINHTLVKSREDLEKSKKKIITTKLDFLFNYIEEEKAVELFESLKLQLNNSQESYNNLVNLYNSITHNEELKILLTEKMRDFETFKKQYADALELFRTSGENTYLINALEIHKTKLAPLGTELMNLKYKSSYIEKNEDDEYIVFQNSHNLEDLIMELKDESKR